MGVEKANCLYRSASKLELLTWHGIETLGSDPAHIELLSLSDMNVRIGAASLFHHYSGEDGVIEVLFRKYFEDHKRGALTQETEYFPLHILGPDDDNLTALFLTIRNQSPRAFEHMIKMLFDFPNVCLSKMMMMSLPRLLSHESEEVVDFFENAVFCPPQMAVEQFIPWSPDMDQLIFASHTSLISRDLLLDKLEDHGIEVLSRRKKKRASRGAEPEEKEASL